ncbi:hypothetical protein METBIDRAFT_47497 [Metschnikowia bicuspidata var. bicuspidata NRRL YB-4993]|uniref:Uncharacterized protein n=1 Tax=Metschnikowia bicuspidata var. bicuspidata NRRL YB-4993 TaxID=869754 RepID=A0A1A0H4W6_9ASCO|nr:hypothetical protein METBIDRAFT_47497 [Metschnikowia bicuspidata var. bicuspidata NRRL YB-4993]OBA18968.1 hypothetical protein METBIDRAFT_47497 [Metschnikowia bicuspidata var. bicuspidata NRRL YB-4993]
MEDITNRQKKAKLDSKPFYPPTQERLPSPSSPSTSLSPQRPHQRQKSVLFELSRNEHFECPLLTPRDEDYDLDSDHIEEKSQEISLGALDSNIDYVALGSTASLLDLTKEHIETEITELASLRTQAQKASKLDLVDFYIRLIYDKQPLPAQHTIVRAPTIDWAKYEEGLANVSLHHDCTNDEENPVFQTMNMFGSASKN